MQSEPAPVHRGHRAQDGRIGLISSINAGGSQHHGMRAPDGRPAGMQLRVGASVAGSIVTPQQRPQVNPIWWG